MTKLYILKHSITGYRYRFKRGGFLGYLNMFRVNAEAIGYLQLLVKIQIVLGGIVSLKISFRTIREVTSGGDLSSPSRVFV